jgi:hypothetical protein
MLQIASKKALSAIDHQGKTLNTKFQKFEHKMLFFGFLMILN